MGGPGSGRTPSAESMVRNLSAQNSVSSGTDNIGFVLPNYSGLKVGAKKTEELTGTSPSLSGSAQVVGIIADTNATPPTASNYALGTLYIQYTA